MNRYRLIGATLTLVVTAPLLLGTAGCRSDSCWDESRAVAVDCAEVTGRVVQKTPASAEGKNPSLVVRTKAGDRRVTLKLEFWNTYQVGSKYP